MLKWMPWRRLVLATGVLLLITQCTFFLDLFGVKPSPIPIGDYTYAIEYADRVIRRSMRTLDIPGAAVALIDDQRVIWDYAYGVADTETGTYLTTDTIIKAGSLTKLFTGIEVMRLSEEGLIDLDAPLVTYLPTFTINSRWTDSGPITLRSILAHRSGLPRNGGLLSWYWESIPNVLKAQTESVAEVHQAFPVGYRYKYSNVGYELLGRLIEVVRQIEPPAVSAPGAFPYYMEQVLLDPVGMHASGFGSRMILYGEEDDLDIASGYYRENGQNVAYNRFDIIELASGNMHTTMGDLEKFAHFVLAGGEGEGGRVIEDDTLELMFEVQYTNSEDPQELGLAWFTDTNQLSEPMVFHSGTNQGNISLLALAPESKVGVILYANSDAFEDLHNQIAVDLIKLLIETKYGITQSESSEPDTVDVDEDELETYVGRYIVNGDVVDVSNRSGRLRATYKGITILLSPVSDRRFISESPAFFGLDELAFTFVPVDSKGAKIMILTLGGSYHITCPAYPTFARIPALWLELEGDYQVFPRHRSIYSDSDLMGTVSIDVVDAILRSSDGKVLLPQNEHEIRIVGGIFDGEYMDVDPSQQTITWQNIVLTWR